MPVEKRTPDAPTLQSWIIKREDGSYFVYRFIRREYKPLSGEDIVHRDKIVLAELPTHKVALEKRISNQWQALGIKQMIEYIEESDYAQVAY